MKQTKYIRTLAIDLSTRGFGFALLEGKDTLFDWGVKTVRGDINNQCVGKVKELIAHYQPGVIVLQNMRAKHSRRSPRTKALSKRIINLATTLNLKVTLFSREQVMQTFFPDGKGTKYALAEFIADKYPEELGFRLPPKRKAWMNEDGRMDIFDAVALGLALRKREKLEKERIR